MYLSSVRLMDGSQQSFFIHSLTSATTGATCTEATEFEQSRAVFEIPLHSRYSRGTCFAYGFVLLPERM
jgi:hypothetical protein